MDISRAPQSEKDYHGNGDGVKLVKITEAWSLVIWFKTDGSRLPQSQPFSTED